MTTFAEGRERNVALGIYGAASGSGAAAGVLLGGVLTSYLSWSWIFFINVPVGIAAIALTPVLLRESRADLPHRHFDLAGAASVTAGLMLLVYATTRATTDGWGAPTTIGLFGGAAALARRVRRDRAPLEVAAPAAAHLPPADAHRRERHDGDRRRGRLLRVLRADALPAGRPPLLGRAERRRLRRASRSRSSSSRTSRRLVVGRFGVRPTLTVGLLASAASVAWLTRLPVDGHYFWDLFPAFVLGGAGMGLVVRPDHDREPRRRRARRRRRRLGADQHEPPDRRRDRARGGQRDRGDRDERATPTRTPRSRSSSAAALDHGFQTALYVLTGLLLARRGDRAHAHEAGPATERSDNARGRRGRAGRGGMTPG